MNYTWGKGWSGWHNLVNCAQLHNGTIPVSPGVYIVAAEKAVTRCVGVDKNGILCIGQTGKLSHRIGQFHHNARDVSKKTHSSGMKYAHLGLTKHFPLKTLRVRWLNLPSKAKAEKKERELMDAYLGEHFELPPLNYAYSWKK